MKLAVPDMISNSYFPAIAAIELGCFKHEGLDVELELIYPVDKCYAALRDGHLAGAALDVFADEPVRPENRYVQLPNVLVAPHLGGATRDVVRHQTDIIVDGIEAWLRGERPSYIANPGVIGQ